MKEKKVDNEVEEVQTQSQANGNQNQSGIQEDIRTEIEGASFQDLSEPPKEQEVSDGNDSTELMSSI